MALKWALGVLLSAYLASEGDDKPVFTAVISPENTCCAGFRHVRRHGRSSAQAVLEVPNEYFNVVFVALLATCSQRFATLPSGLDEQSLHQGLIV